MNGCRKGRSVHTVRASFELVTPAFCGGAAPTGPAEIRLPHILGALRFWWRALAWARTSGGSPVQRLQRIKDCEEELFGGAARKVAGGKQIGQGTFLARLLLRDPPEDLDAYERRLARLIGGYPRSAFERAAEAQDAVKWEQDGVGVTYLANQGLTGRDVLIDEDGNKIPHHSPTPWRPHATGSQDIRPSLPPGYPFELELRSHQPFPIAAEEDALPTVVESMVALGLLGGIGARARRGFGSLRLRVLRRNGDPIDLPRTPDDCLVYVRRLLKVGAACSEPWQSTPYTALTGHTRAYVVRRDDRQDIRRLHNDMGFHLLYYRSAGFQAGRERRAGNVAKLAAKHLFEPEHQWFTALANDADFEKEKVNTDTLVKKVSTGIKSAGTIPRRAVFGLPHNYFRQKDRHAVRVSPIDADRRASPLMLRLHKFDDSVMAVWLLLPSRFLPASPQGRPENVQVERAKGKRDFGAPGKFEWDAKLEPILDFFDKEHLPGVEEVLVPTGR